MDARREASGECLACDLASGAARLPGGRVHQTESWVVEHCIGPLGVGTLLVKPFRHVLHIAELTDAESAELGPLLRRVAAAVEEVVRPEQVYVCLWSHSGGTPGHIHFVVQPATRDLMERFDGYGPKLQMAMFTDGAMPNEAEVEAICARFRAQLNTAGPTS
ncbi:HIT family protein [Saccharopolyspora shandongensis]|uniref:HIT family protein n=1 Tax=Saccharopolyspora shandongensis TaxID=418495 RepID=UPI0033C8BBCF